MAAGDNRRFADDGIGVAEVPELLGSISPGPQASAMIR